MRKIVKPLLAGAGVTGAIAATNRALSNAPLATNALGGTRRPWTWRGYDIFATEAGHGPPVLLVHGVSAGASSFEYRKLFPLLAQRHRVVAFDLIGSGLSDKPKIRYDADLFVDQIIDALAAFGEGESVSIVGSSLGGAFSIRAASRALDGIRRLAVICPSGLSGTGDRGPRGPGGAAAALLRAPLLGEALFNLMGTKPSIESFLRRNVYADPASVTPEVIDRFYALMHQPGARYVPAAFVGGALDCDVARDLPFLQMPLEVLWGERAPAINPRAHAVEFLRLARDARLVTFANSGLLPHEEEPEAVDASLRAFLSPTTMLESA